MTLDPATLAELDGRLRTLLPEDYQGSYESIEPVSMGSAGLKYGPDGRVAWNEMWATFCDLAMAGGPPHKGTLLAPASPAAIAAEPDRYATVVDEICRGIRITTGLDPGRSDAAGWITVPCLDATAADWLVRAIVMENVAARRQGRYLEVPAGPAFRLEKEIKNVVTVVAKTCHYWEGHMQASQHRAIGELFEALAASGPLVTPAALQDPLALASWRDDAAAMADRIEAALALRRSADAAPGWLGVDCASVRAAVWTMRALVASNVLARREGTTLCLPVDPAGDPGGERVVRALALVHGLASARGLF